MPELSDDHKAKIRKLWHETPIHSSYIEEQLSIRFSPEEVLTALMEATNKEFAELALIEWTSEEILQTVKDTKVISSKPIIEEEIILNESIIPDGVMRTFLEEQVKFKGERWIIHKYDADPFPSNPHAHNYEAGLKLHLGNGGLYHGSELSGSITCKKLKELRALFKKTKMPKLEC
ncbi:hypothetical protein [Shewanella algae]|uniref:hypothetical protein n=1 Tax=Shewanella algae TaxID=38313 RepID=UPI00119ED2F3|nr:hypothetical protein [Shewanella algae]QNV06448.1 hypothetical protein EIY89_15780 [Shewanella algae]TWO82872.1 hypothetical protein AYI75_18275 [Shewanella algae]